MSTKMHSLVVIWLAPKLWACPLNGLAAVLYKQFLHSGENLSSVVLSLSPDLTCPLVLVKFCQLNLMLFWMAQSSRKLMVKAMFTATAKSYVPTTCVHACMQGICDLCMFFIFLTWLGIIFHSFTLLTGCIAYDLWGSSAMPVQNY